MILFFVAFVNCNNSDVLFFVKIILNIRRFYYFYKIHSDIESKV